MMIFLVKRAEEVRDCDMVFIMNPIGVDVEILGVVTSDKHKAIAMLHRWKELAKFVKIRQQEENGDGGIIRR
jgi:hypothetical protein